MLPEIGSELLSTVALLAAIGVWIVSDWSIAFAHRGTADDSRDRGSKYAIGAAVVGGVLAAVVLSQVTPGLSVPAPTVAFWLGVGTILLGVVLRQYAVRTLGDGFDLEVTVDAADEVVDSGPYRWVRHPSYTGALLSLVGVGITVGNWLSIAVALVAGIAGYGYRIRVEERALRETLGERYAAYTNRTPYRLVPGVW
ncbi:methyltransferase family protein [Natronorubrum daqingense]|uniref:Nickel-cobalt-cadmium resistance protein n=1 Tax=Natronorubrum daqingense TaxID=588898 RepID=A0A1N7C019_9EURY|nr:isoprenylcysteine carboxylmethyltransferase family protein [Natronorubrum daqingense]APX96674.1 nickel-cobalt-cadmium resistance protein [Natronorubrum daqingense]SIR56936.1 Protein-S-isoprenylcysteine O-methyltransferase Ste14 [Natronorubrum daqingense]